LIKGMVLQWTLPGMAQTILKPLEYSY